jgi:hypothetical protein
MPRYLLRALYWAPRLLSVVFVVFLSLFALDVFDSTQGFWQTLLALLLHLTPSFVIAAVVWAAWRHEWIGAALFAAAAAFYIGHTVRLPLSTDAKWEWCLALAGPALLIAVLYFWNWLKRQELREAL